MQNAKDSFYMALRTRLAAINPERTILLRGTVRPGILVEEAEAPFSQLPNDVFILRWLGLGVDMDLGSTMAAEECEILYQTAGRRVLAGWIAGVCSARWMRKSYRFFSLLHTEDELHFAATSGVVDASLLGRSGVLAGCDAA